MHYFLEFDAGNSLFDGVCNVGYIEYGNCGIKLQMDIVRLEQRKKGENAVPFGVDKDYLCPIPSFTPRTGQCLE